MYNFIKYSFIGKHWRGDYSLPFSYWLISLFTNITVIITSVLIVGYIEAQPSFNPYILALCNLLLFSTLLSLTLWHLVGTWRSATFYSLKPENKKSYWGGITKFFLAFSALKSAIVIFTYGSTVIVLMQIAFGNDANIPNYRITITEAGTELKIEGGLKYGIVKDVETLLKSAPDVKTVNLESVGGRIGVAEDLYELLIRNNLNTVTNDFCLSACTIVFAAGNERWLGVGARLGFHAAKFETMNENETRWQKININNKIAAKNGTSKNFLNKGDNTPNKDIWYPTRSELFAEKYLTSFAPKANSSISLIEQNLNQTAQEIKKTTPIKLNDNITLTDVKVYKTKLVYFYDITDKLNEVFKIKSIQSDQIKEVTSSVCNIDSMKNDMMLGITYGYYYKESTSQMKSLYFEVKNCNL